MTPREEARMLDELDQLVEEVSGSYEIVAEWMRDWQHAMSAADRAEGLALAKAMTRFIDHRTSTYGDAP